MTVRIIAFLAVFAPSLAVGITTLEVAKSLDWSRPWPLVAGEAVAVSAFIGLNYLTSILIAHLAARRG
ncbi:hypothetical protein F7R91_14600 [Streptomyces luteolifulvus]|uniref:Uncharacterized protein n=1 Tax=Streptomyces luteolifulvus TaxID=2615112 RepID=A0A6H9V1L0_9ACTN|nr:hypothetical protein [Streptomyces luteolifulvus]KAB1146805.1 hypothetical protein F7R91_14600 [Streptomyces luteolifulvus]